MQEKVISLNALKDLKRKAIDKVKEAIEFAKYKDSRRLEFEKWFIERRMLFDDCEEIGILMRQYIYHAGTRF